MYGVYLIRMKFSHNQIFHTQDKFFKHGIFAHFGL